MKISNSKLKNCRKEREGGSYIRARRARNERSAIVGIWEGSLPDPKDRIPSRSQRSRFALEFNFPLFYPAWPAYKEEGEGKLTRERSAIVGIWKETSARTLLFSLFRPVNCEMSVCQNYLFRIAPLLNRY